MALHRSMLMFWMASEISELDKISTEILMEDDSEDEELLLLAMCSSSSSDRVKVHNYYEEVISSYLPDDFRRHFRMSRITLETVLPLILSQNKIPLVHVKGREPMDPCKQVLIGIWFLGNQEVYRSVADRFGVTMSSVHLAFSRLCSSLVSMKKDIIVWPTGSTVLSVFEGFEEMGKIPRVLGAIDGCHVPIKAPAEQGQAYINRKKFHSIVLQAVCDHTMKLTDIYVGWPGSVHDARVLRNSPLAARSADIFPADSHLLGDSAYPLHSWLIPTFRDNGHLTNQQKAFNAHHSSARQIIERSFALLKGRWRKLKYIDVNVVEVIPRIITAACVLHNLCLNDDVSDFISPEEPDDDNETAQLQFYNGTAPTEAAHAKRNTLAAQ